MEFLINSLCDVANEADNRNLETVSEDLTSLMVLLSKFAEVNKEAYIQKVQIKGKTKYKVRSPNNKDWSGGVYNTREEAEKRLKEIEMFKHMKD